MMMLSSLTYVWINDAKIGRVDETRPIWFHKGCDFSKGDSLQIGVTF